MLSLSTKMNPLPEQQFLNLILVSLILLLKYLSVLWIILKNPIWIFSVSSNSGISCIIQLHVTATPLCYPLYQLCLSYIPEYYQLLTITIYFPHLKQSSMLPMAPYHLLCSICVTYWMPCLTSFNQTLPNSLPREI